MQVAADQRDLGAKHPDKRAYPWDYIYEPDAKSVLDELLARLHRGVRLSGGQRQHRVANRARAWSR